jgi:hypothetical protein
MLEKQIERRFCEAIKHRGGLSYKLAGLVCGLPDRVVILPGGRIVFVELKTLSGRLSKIQKLRIEELKTTGIEVRVLYGWEDAQDFISEVFSR